MFTLYKIRCPISDIDNYFFKQILFDEVKLIKFNDPHKFGSYVYRYSILLNNDTFFYEKMKDGMYFFYIYPKVFYFNLLTNFDLDKYYFAFNHIINCIFCFDKGEEYEIIDNIEDATYTRANGISIDIERYQRQNL